MKKFDKGILKKAGKCLLKVPTSVAASMYLSRCGKNDDCTSPYGRAISAVSHSNMNGYFQNRTIEVISKDADESYYEAVIAIVNDNMSDNFKFETICDLGGVVMKEYIYEGPVKEFDRIISYNWKASTFAISEQKARSNLTYRYKKEHNRGSGAKITLPGKLVCV